jgi:AraC family transcriptional activator FtrA
MDRSELVDPWYELLVCAAEPPPLRATGGITIDTPHRLDALARADTIIVPAWRDEHEVPPHDVLEALRREHDRGARIMSVCSGAFVLAHAGLLDGRRATTHWKYAALMAERFPLIEVDPDVLYVVDGDVMTSAGTAAGIDLCLHVVRLDHGAAVANAVARRMVVPPHRSGGQAQYVQAPVPDACEPGDPLAQVLDWAVANLDRPLSVDQLAAKATMSPAHLRPPLPGGGRHDAPPVARPPAGAARAAAAGGDGTAGRPCRERGGLRVGHGPAPALRPHRRHVAARLPAHVRGEQAS